MNQGFLGFEWSRWDPWLGLYHMIGVLLVLNLAENVGADWLAAGVGALLAWLTVLLGQARSKRAEISGLVIYMLAAMPLSYLAHAVAPVEAVSLGLMFAVTFGFSMLMTKGAHAFVIGWCLTYWYLLSPLLSGSLGVTETAMGHLIGAGAVIVLYGIRRLWWRQAVETQTGPVAEGRPSTGFAAAYSAIVGLTMVVGLGVGARTLKADPTLISNSAFNIISPSASQTWRSGILRMLFGTAGICLGFYLGVFFPQVWVGQLIIALSSFFAMALVRVDFGPVIGALFVMVSYPWGTMGLEAGNAIANERILAELAGVILAGVAVFALGLLVKFMPQQ
jgi:hypothetical protein